MTHEPSRISRKTRRTALNRPTVAETATQRHRRPALDQLSTLSSPQVKHSKGGELSTISEHLSSAFGFFFANWAAILGVLGFGISVWNWSSAIRNRTVNAQPQLLAELRKHLDTALRECQNVRVQVTFDRYMISQGHRPTVNPRPDEFDTVLARLPELAFTITSIGQNQIETMKAMIEMVDYNWKVLQGCLEADEIPDTVLEFSRAVRLNASLVVKFLPEYVTAVRDINKGNLWKRFKYRDHSRIVRKLFRWPELGRSVSEYGEFLRSV